MGTDALLLYKCLGTEASELLKKVMQWVLGVRLSGIRLAAANQCAVCAQVCEVCAQVCAVCAQVCEVCAQVCAVCAQVCVAQISSQFLYFLHYCCVYKTFREGRCQNWASVTADGWGCLWRKAPGLGISDSRRTGLSVKKEGPRTVFSMNADRRRRKNRQRRASRAFD